MPPLTESRKTIQPKFMSIARCMQIGERQEMGKSTMLKSLKVLALPMALLAVMAVAPVHAAEPTDPIADVGKIDIIGVRANANSPFYIKGEPFGAGVWKSVSPPSPIFSSSPTFSSNLAGSSA